MREYKTGHVSRLPESILVRIGFVFLVILHFPEQNLAFDNTTSTFVERCRVDCTLKRDLVTCGKFRVVRWLHNVVREKEFSYGPLRIVRIPSLPGQSILPKVPQSRVFRSSAVEALNFVRDAVEDMLTKRAVVYTIDNAVAGRSFGTMPMIMDEDEITQLQSRKESDDDWRLFKKKKSVILPLLILLNLLKLKLLLLPVFLGVHFIKKLLVLGSLLLPSILSHLKICKVPQQAHQMNPYHTWATAAEAPADYPTGYGQEEAWAHRNDYQGHLGYPGYPAFRNPYG
ncbi:uncharacterized protein LOC143357684 [Halictus rubicundus]|uniref:uncharacterized protein LOC143357684 n=1 Tax=Halictus rubicundus TaxID=77578 RepID=UPI004035A48A